MIKRKKVEVNKQNPIESAIVSINAEFGDGALQRIGSKKASIPTSGVWSTGFETIDSAWGRGGAPRGRVVILHGKEGAGKTTVGLTMAAAAQRSGAVVLILDVEYKLDLDWAVKCGLNIDDAIISQPEYLEKAVAIIDATVAKVAENDLSTYVIIDSMNGCDTKAEFECTWEEKEHYGPKAEVYSRILPKLVPRIKKTNSVLVLVSQVRGGPKGDHIACGNAPKFYSSSIIKFAPSYPVHKVKSGNKIVAVELEAEFIKNQVASPYQKAKFRITPDGPDFDWSLIECAAEKGIVSKADKGGLYEWKREEGDLVKWRGINAWRKLLEKNPEYSDELRNLVRE